MGDSNKKILIFNEIGFHNLVLCYLCSLFTEVRTFKFKSLRIKNMLKRIQVLDFEGVVSGDEALIFKTTGIQSWSEITKRPIHPKEFDYKFQDLEFSSLEKAWKDFGVVYDQYEVLRLIKDAYHQDGWKIVDHFDHYLMRKYFPVVPPEAGSFIVKVISAFNIFFGFVQNQCYHLLAIFVQALYSLKILLIGKEETLRPKIIWDAINSSELSNPVKESCNAFWILKYSNMSKEDILFINPEKKFFLGKEPVCEGVHFFYSIFHVMASLPFKLRLKVFLFSSKNVLLSLLFSMVPSHKLRKLYREQELLCWKLVVDYFGIQTYVDSVSSSMLSRHQILLLNNLKVHTVFYLYSANSFIVTSQKKNEQARHLSYSKILHNRAVVWHQKYKDILLGKYNDKMEIDVIGPLMSCQEYFSDIDVDDLRMKHLKISDKKYTYISIYDVAPQMKGWHNGLLSFYPSIYNKDFCAKFLADIDRLFREMDDIVIVYKPKRNILNKQYPFPQSMNEILDRNANNPRWINLSNSANPWVPIMLADINISIPFTSTTFAAMGKNKKFLYHNPDEIAKFHEYDELKDYISTSYDQLKEKVLALKEGKSLGDYTKTKFFVPEPEGGYTQAFANYLKKISHLDGVQ